MYCRLPISGLSAQELSRGQFAPAHVTRMYIQDMPPSLHFSMGDWSRGLRAFPIHFLHSTIYVGGLTMEKWIRSWIAR